MRNWETEMLALDNITGDLVRVGSTVVFEAENMQQAQQSLLNSGLVYLRLTGASYEKEDETEVEETTEQVKDEIDELNDNYERLIDPRNFVSEMTTDEFCDWLELGSEADVRATLAAFEKAGMEEHVLVIKGHLKHFYGDKD